MYIKGEKEKKRNKTIQKREKCTHTHTHTHTQHNTTQKKLDGKKGKKQQKKTCLLNVVGEHCCNGEEFFLNL
jgi:hypothetical protein